MVHMPRKRTYAHRAHHGHFYERLSHSARALRPFQLYIIVLLLSVIGLFFVFESSSVRSIDEYGNSFHYFNLHALRILMGCGLMVFFSFFDYRRFQNLAFPAMMGAIGLLFLVLIPGIGSKVGGARSWIELGALSFQPTDFAKVAVIIYLATWFMNKEKKRFVPFISLMGFLVLLIMMQPDMGTATIILAISVVMYFLAGSQLTFLFALVPTMVAGFALLAVVAPYRVARITAFMNPNADPQGVGYHINQIFISLHNGGIFGRGFGASKQKYLYLPEAHTDSIFAIIGEEFGFIGASLLIFLLFVFLYRLYQITYSSKDRFGMFLGGGILAYFAIQIIINLGGMVALMPLTGVPLPFISYGGSNLLVSYALVGVLVSIARHARQSSR